MRRVLLILCVVAAVAAGVQAFATTVVSDTFTCASDLDLVTHTPDTGTSWSEVIDNGGGSNFIECTGSVDQVRPDAAADTTTLVALAAPSPSGTSYDVTVTLGLAGGGADDPTGLIFGYADSSNFCAALIFPAGTTPDLRMYKVVAGTPSEIGTAVDTGPATNGVFKVEVRGASDLVFLEDGVSQMTAPSTGCVSASGTGIFWGNVRGLTDDVTTSSRLDNFLVEEQSVATGAPRLLLLGVGRPQ